jgi:hypothetical protein
MKKANHSATYCFNFRIVECKEHNFGSLKQNRQVKEVFYIPLEVGTPEIQEKENVPDNNLHSLFRVSTFQATTCTEVLQYNFTIHNTTCSSDKNAIKLAMGSKPHSR